MQPSEVASLKLSREEPERAHDREEKLCGEIGENFPGSIQEYLEKGRKIMREFVEERRRKGCLVCKIISTVLVISNF